MTLALSISGDTIHDTFRAWNEERESLDAQLSESLAALSAYQSHLDAWQKQLSSEREELRTAREQVERDRAADDTGHAEASAAMAAELQAARDKMASLTTLLLTRTEELRTLDNRRAELQTELELERAREKELKTALDDQKLAVDEQRSQWAEELRQLRELLERQLETPPVETPTIEPPTTEEPALAIEEPERPASAPAPASGAPAVSQESPVLGSIVQQFDKLRQQRAVGRQAVSKPK